MKATELMLGNKVAQVHDHKPDNIVALEDGMVHLADNKLADDERDIEGVPLTTWILEMCGDKQKGKLLTIIKGIKLHFTVIRSTKRAILVFQLNEPYVDVFLAFHHQLQNFIFVLTGLKLSDEHVWSFEEESNSPTPAKTDS